MFLKNIAFSVYNLLQWRSRKRKRRGGFLRKAAAFLVIIAMLFALKNLIGDRLILTKDGIVWSGDLDPVYQQAGNMSDTLRQLVKNNPITPYRVAKFAEQNGYYEGDAGTSWALMTEGAAQFGVYGEEMGLSEEAVFSSLENGNPIICSMSPGDFTTTGHFIVLVGIEDGKIRVNDPNSVKRSEKLWDYETLYPQISNLWVYTAG